MRRLTGGLLGALAAMWVTGAEAQTRLTPASPQPDKAELEQGLAVRYAYPGDIKYLDRAASWEEYGTVRGEPLVGFDYPDTRRGEPALTSNAAERVIAWIDGYIWFPEEGIWKMLWHSNDGLEVKIGGAKVYRHDGRHSCTTLGWQEEFMVPEAGWYEVEALYFQRLATSCLLMKWQPPGGEMQWTPNDAFAYRPE